MNICRLFTILFIFLNISCSKEDNFEFLKGNHQELFLQLLQDNISIKNIEQNSSSYKILFSDNSMFILARDKDLFFTSIGNDKNWLINGVNTYIPAKSNLSNSKAELQSIDVDSRGYWSINGKSTDIRTEMPIEDSEIPTIKNIIQTNRFFYFYFTDRTILKFVNQKANVSYEKRTLPSHPASLKILCVGNSFTDDATVYLPLIVKSAGINNVFIGRVIVGGGSLKQLCDSYIDNSSQCIYEITDDKMKWKTVSRNYSLKDALKYADWDIITFQQLSHDAGRYQTYQPYLSNLIDIAKSNGNNSDAIFAWQMPWAYSSGCTEEVFGKYGFDQQKMYEAITKTTKIMMNNSDIDVLAPVGTAIQNLRRTSLNNPPLDITVDNRHLDYGAGRYTAACVLFQTLIAPCYDIDLFDTSFTAPYGNIFVTEENYKICQKAAFDACKNPF